MKRMITLSTILAILASTSMIYAQDEKSINDELKQNRQQQVTLDQKIKELDFNIKNIQDNIDTTNEELSLIDQESNKVQEKIESLKLKIQENQEALGERLKAVNKNYSMSYIKIILSSDSISEFFNNVYVVGEIIEQDKQMISELDANKADVEKEQAKLDQNKKRQEELIATLQENNEAVLADKEEVEVLKAELVGEEETLQKELEKLALESGQSSGVDTNTGGGVISDGSWPVPGHTRISSPYGYRIHPILNTQKMHTGIDIPAPQGTPVVSIDSGTVTYAGTMGGYGKTIMVSHDDGKVSLYAHNHNLTVSKGQRVEKGSVIAKVGSTGQSTGNHLHFEIRINGKHTNPMNYL